MRENSIYTQFLKYIILVFLVVSTSLRADNNLKFNHITVIDGLLHNSATSVAQDSAGFIWIGTQLGLNRFDGYKLDSYINETDVYTSVFSNRVRKIVIDRNYIWTATFQGIQCFDISKKRYINFIEQNTNGLSRRQNIQNLFVDSQRRIWVGTAGKMECAQITTSANELILKNVSFDNAPYLELPEKITPEMTALNNGTIIILAGSRLYKIQVNPKNPTDFSLIAFSSFFPNIQNIKADGDDLWLFSENKAYKVVVVDQRLEKIDEVSFPNCVVVGAEFTPTHLWMSTNQGVFKIDKLNQNERVQFYSHSAIDPNSVCSNHQSAIFIDNQDNLWISTWSAGVSYASIGKQKFELVKYMPVNNNKYLPSEFVYSIHEDNKGDIYVGTKFGGISRFNLQTKTFDYTINLKEKLGVNTVVPCIVSDDQWIYAGITFRGTSIYRIHKLTRVIELVKSYSPNTVFSFDFDNHQQLWVGVLGVGLSCLKINNGRVVSEKLYTTQSDPKLNLSSNDVNFVFVDKQKNEVLASTVNGINRLMLNENGEVSAIAYYLADIQNPRSLSSNYVWPIDKENDSVYWVGTMGSGLNRVVIGERVSGKAVYTAERFNTAHGAPSNNIESVQVDKFGNVWCGGMYLSQFDYKRKRFKTYYEEDGLQSYLFGTGTSCKARNGMLFFGGLRGMNYFMPDTIVEKKQFKVVLSRLIVDAKSIAVGDTINGRVILDRDLQYISKVHIPYPSNNLRIDFSSLTFSRKKSIQYRYKLQGFDREWIYTNGMNAFAMYPKLPYRNYQFIVEVGADNEWDGIGKILEIEIHPPWWRTIWAYSIYIVLILIVTILIARYSFNWINMKRQISLQTEREKQKEELMELKMIFFTNISHEFKTPLTLINAAVSEIETKNEQPKESRNFEILKGNNSKLLFLISELMDFQRSNASLMELRTIEINVCDFLQEIFDEFKPLSERSEITMQLTLPKEPVYAWVDEECLAKIISNVISNSLRYTEKGGAVNVRLLVGQIINYESKFDSKVLFTEHMHTGDHLIFTVTDNGVGISGETLPDIFERYHTLNSKTTKHLGSGVGLALVKSLVELHKGGVLVSSERNVGTEFVFSIPLNSDYFKENQKVVSSEFDKQLYFDDYREQFHESEIVLVNTNDESKPTILFVEDNKDILLMLHEHFKEDYNILIAFDGVEGLKLCNENLPDIVVSDIMMPKMDGLELLSQIKSLINTCYIPVVLLTARGTVEQQIEGIDEGADAYIPKPFHLELLRSTITNLLNKVKLSKERISLNNDDVKITRNAVMDREKQQLMDKLVSIIKDNISNPNYSIDKLCLEIGISRSRLYAQMKTITTETLGEIIREIRLQKAAELLRTTTLPMSEVAYHVGIESPSFFTRSFKERFGVTPTEYAKRAINENL